MDEISGFWVGAMQRMGRTSVPELAEALGSWSALEGGGAEALVAAGVPPLEAAAWASTPPLRTRGRAITLASPDYPPALLDLGVPPPVLLVEGALAALAGPAVAVVGTRRCSRYGAQVADGLGSGLARAGACVVSGLALGIDARAHAAALRSGRTVAVLGHGLGHTAPPSHRGLRQAIVEGGGAVLSVWPDDFEPRPWTFPLRNRWIAGLSAATVVVEAPTRSGALITAAEAAGIGREVYAVPGPLGAAASAGCLDLLASGARIVTSVDALVAELVGAPPPDRPAWLERLLAGDPLDAVARAAGWSITELLGELSSRELRGELVRLAPGRYGEAGRR